MLILIVFSDILELAINGAGGDASNLNSCVDIEGMLQESHHKFHDFYRLALRGSEIAEKLAFVHRNRPCFKKIDSLCARMKQDLIRSDNVLPNINSQGIAWAVKDFIFVFTRIINAWIIVKGYVYNTPEGLSTVKAALSTDFPANFIAWQSSTTDFIDSLTRSFINLDNLVQMRSTFQKAENNGAAGQTNKNGSDCNTGGQSNGGRIIEPETGLPSLSEETTDDDSKNNTTDTENPGNSLEEANFHFTAIAGNCAQNAHDIKMAGKYFKTGTYLPLKKDVMMENGASSSATLKGEPVEQSTSGIAENILKIVNIPNNCNPLQAMWPENAYATNKPSSPGEEKTNSGQNGDSCLMDTNNDPTMPSSSEVQLTERDSEQFLAYQLMEQINAIIECLMSMHTADLFFKAKFTKNYVSFLLTQVKKE